MATKPTAALQMTPQLWASSDGALRPEHRKAFVLWAQSQKIQTATAHEWRVHFQTYRTTPVR